MGIEDDFDAAFASRLSLREKQIQQRYRPVIGVHKWFARRPGALFRALLLAEFACGDAPLSAAYWSGHRLTGRRVADPFMGGGTTVYEAARLGLDVRGNDINPMSHWLVRRALDPVGPAALRAAAAAVTAEVAAQHGALYRTRCLRCDQPADVKYFLWVKHTACPACAQPVDVFTSRLLAKDARHRAFVTACAACGALNETPRRPTEASPAACVSCAASLTAEGNARSRRGRCRCLSCGHGFDYPGERATPPAHRMWAIEYRCAACYPAVEGRQFKAPDPEDLALAEGAAETLAASAELSALIPPDRIPEGDETGRLFRWGYRHWREMFSPRQRLLLASLARSLRALPDQAVRHALFTVWSDILRYNNLLCRYDTSALKCQDIFSVHGFPVGLVQCEANVLGIPGVGSGGFVHFVEKYARAAAFCARPFEVRLDRSKAEVSPEGESISAPAGEVQLSWGPSQAVEVPPGSLDGVFTDPPYFANVQYAELIDFCYVWLRHALGEEVRALLSATTTRSAEEAVGNTTAGRGVEAFTAALSAVFVRFCGGLRPGAPLVFTYHHNDPAAYLPVVVAVLDAGLVSSAVLPAAAEMTASRHISGTGSSVLDSVFVCRHPDHALAEDDAPTLLARLIADAQAMREAGVRLSEGDVLCLLAGHLAHRTTRALAATGWQREAPVEVRLRRAGEAMTVLQAEVDVPSLVRGVLSDA